MGQKRNAECFGNLYSESVAKQLFKVPRNHFSSGPLTWNVIIGTTVRSVHMRTMFFHLSTNLR